MTVESLPSIMKLENIDVDTEGSKVGGKAKGLAELIHHGLSVPPGFVILNAQAGEYPEDLESAYKALGETEVAVRSSALGEDAGDFSFAGQFETILNVQGIKALKKAIDDCVESLQTERAAAYQQDHDHEQEATMCVVVQIMVDAAYAGVLFTADPVSGRHDRLVIDAVAGLGEALVSGEASSDHYVLDPSNHLVDEQLSGDKPLLEKELLAKMADQARDAVKKFADEPLDMEWAIDQQGRIFWLQARPITTIGSDFHELDSVIKPNHVVTRCNVGEIFPGPCCPLTFSLQGHALDVSLRYMQSRFSGQKPVFEDVLPQICYSSGYLFLDLTASVESSKYTLMARAETTAQSICGRTIPELVEPTDKKNILRRVWGIKDFIRFILESKRVVAEYAQKLKTLSVDYQHDSVSMYEELKKKNEWLDEASTIHLQSSAYSGTMEGIIQGIITKGEPSPSLEQQALAAKLFAGAKNVESAVLVEQLDKVVDLIAKHPHGKQRFHDASPSEALDWLTSDEAGSAKEAYKNFLENHGHRTYKELCLMHPGWIDDEESLVESMQASLMARFRESKEEAAEVPLDLKSQPRAIRWFLPKAHASIRQREHSKSMMVKTTHIIKRAYRHLGKLLASESKLDDPELVFFMTFQELGDFVHGRSPELHEKAKKRKLAFDYQEKLAFTDIYVGEPEPVEITSKELIDGQLSGRPVSKGVVEGVVRVAHNVHEAAGLQPGEILVAPVTDVGWTPYFSLIAGLATDVGSAVSHGAVIAREYGLPCIVNMQVATSTFKTGDRVRLDADTGIITRLDE